jgi:hypothetical protein
MRYGILLISLMILSLSIPTSQAYVFRGVFHDDGGVNHIAITPSFYYQGNCSVNIYLNATASNSGLAYTLGNSWYEPDAILLASTNPPYPLPQTCGFQGNYTGNTSLYDFYESKTATTTTASSTSTWVTSIYDCEPNGTLNDLNRNILYTNTTVNDSFGYHPYAYAQTLWSYIAGGLQSEPSLATLRATMLSQMVEYEGSCSGTGLVHDAYNAASRSNLPANFAGIAWWIVVPFNSQYAGRVNISIPSQTTALSTSGWSCTLGQYIQLYDRTAQQWQTLGSGLPFTAQLTLPIGYPRDYYLAIGSVCTHGGGTTLMQYRYTTYNISITAYQPSVSCGSYGECTGGVRSRNCIDLNGLLPAWIDYDTAGCAAALPAYQNVIGFEDFYQRNVYICKKQFWGIPICADDLKTISPKYPKGWTAMPSTDITGTARQNYIDMTSEAGATEGTLALKMWYYPPKISEPIADPGNSSLTVCGNNSNGASPEITHGYNNTLFIASNISFPSQYMDLRFTIRRCASPVEQYFYGTTGLPLDCYFKYYNTENDPGIQPSARYGLRLYNAILPTQILVDYYSEAANEWKDKIIDLSNAGIIAGNNYTIALAVNPENQLDSRHHCVYFDNFRVAQRIAAFACTSHCEGVNWLSMETTSPCTFTIDYNSDKCNPSNVSAQILAKETYCLGTTRHYYNNMTGFWETVENSSYCVYLLQQQQQQENLSGVNPILGAVLGASNTGTLVNAGFGFAISTIFIVFLIDIGIASYITVKTKPKSGGGASWELGFVILGGLMLIESIPPYNIFPPFFTAIFIIFLGVTGAELLHRKAKGG